MITDLCFIDWLPERLDVLAPVLHSIRRLEHFVLGSSRTKKDWYRS